MLSTAPVRPAIKKLIAERKATKDLAADPEVLPLLKQGRPSGDARKGDDVTSSERGNSASYLVRKLKRARPEIADALARGEIHPPELQRRRIGIPKARIHVTRD